MRPIIGSPLPHDVLCGRGGKSNNHHGNSIFRTVVARNRELYRTCPKHHKGVVAKTIVEAVKSLDPPGRFLSKGEDDMWYEIDDKKAIEKTSQALREKDRIQQTCDREGDDFFSSAAAAADGNKRPEEKRMRSSNYSDDEDKKKTTKKKVKMIGKRKKEESDPLIFKDESAKQQKQQRTAGVDETASTRKLKKRSSSFIITTETREEHKHNEVIKNDNEDYSNEGPLLPRPPEESGRTSSAQLGTFTLLSPDARTIQNSQREQSTTLLTAHPALCHRRVQVDKGRTPPISADDITAMGMVEIPTTLRALSSTVNGNSREETSTRNRCETTTRSSSPNAFAAEHVAAGDDEAIPFPEQENPSDDDEEEDRKNNNEKNRPKLIAEGGHDNNNKDCLSTQFWDNKRTTSTPTTSFPEVHREDSHANSIMTPSSSSSFSTNTASFVGGAADPSTPQVFESTGTSAWQQQAPFHHYAAEDQNTELAFVSTTELFIFPTSTTVNDDGDTTNAQLPISLPSRAVRDSIMTTVENNGRDAISVSKYQEEQATSTSYHARSLDAGTENIDLSSCATIIEEEFNKRRKRRASSILAEEFLGENHPSRIVENDEKEEGDSSFLDEESFAFDCSTQTPSQLMPTRRNRRTSHLPSLIEYNAAEIVAALEDGGEGVGQNVGGDELPVGLLLGDEAGGDGVEVDTKVVDLGKNRTHKMSYSYNDEEFANRDSFDNHTKCHRRSVGSFMATKAKSTRRTTALLCFEFFRNDVSPTHLDTGDLIGEEGAPLLQNVSTTEREVASTGRGTLVNSHVRSVSV